MFNTYILPHIDYGAMLWSPYRKKDIAVIENIQRRFTKMIHGLHNCSYEERLTILSLPTLEERRRRNDLIQVFKIWNGIDRIEGSLFKNVSEIHNKNTRRSQRQNFVVQKSRLDIRKHFFSCRVINDWNRLPHKTQVAPNIQVFKTELMKVSL